MGRVGTGLHFACPSGVAARPVRGARPGEARLPRGEQLHKMASAGWRARPKMAAGGAGERGRSEPRRVPGRHGQGALESGCPKTAAAQPAGEAPPPAGSRRPSSVGARGKGRRGGGAACD